MTPAARNVAHALLDAYGRADDSHHALEAELDALTGGRSTFVLLDVQRERRNARPPFVAPRDPGLVLARTLSAAPSSPAPQRPSPRPAFPWRVGGDLAFLFLVVALPLASGLLVDRWIR